VKALIGNQTAVQVATLLLLSAAGPAAAGQEISSVEWAAATPLPPVAVMSGLRTPYDRPTLLVAQSSCQWLAQMVVLAASGSLEAGPEAEPAGVDWTNQTAAVVALGSVPYGYSLELVEARRNLNELLLEVHVGYQSYENNIEDVSPAATLVVNGQGMNVVRVMYDLDIPGLLDQATMVPCVAPRSAIGPSTDAAPGAAMTWGALKGLYR
jgi:hypothetical protein